MNARTLRITLVILVPLALVWLALSLPFAAQASRPSETAAPLSPLTATLRWQDELVDKLGDVGDGSSLALDSDGNPHIAYYDFTHHTLKYAAWNGTAWTLDTVAASAGYTNTNDAILKSALAYANGVAYIAYEQYNEPYTPSHRVLLAVGGPGAWQLSGLPLPSSDLETVSPVMRRDTGGSLHLAFVQRALDELNNPYHQIIYARQDPASPAWLTRTVTTIYNWDPVVLSLALDASNQPHIAWASNIVPTLYYAHWNGTAWLSQTVTTNGNWPSLALDAGGNPRIAYLDYLTLKYTTWISPAWQTVTLGHCGFCKSGPSLALNYLDQPRVALERLYAQWNGSAWLTETLKVPAVPIGTSLALDSGGKPHISYLDLAYSDLHHVSWDTDWQTVPVAIGYDARLAVDLRGRPFVSYIGSGNSGLQLVNWGSSGVPYYRTVAHSALYDSLELQYDVDRQPLPILSYQRGQNLEVANWNGTAFVTRTVDYGTYSGYYTSLGLNGTDAAVGYFDLNRGVRYASSSLNGFAWNLRTDLAQPSPIATSIRSLSLGIAPPNSRRSYIAYYHAISHTLRLATWDGTYWTDEVVPDGSGDNVGQYASLAVDRASGEPAIAYYDATNQSVKYAYRNSNTWTIRVVEAGLVNVTGLALQLALASNQYPRIAFTVGKDNSLRLAWSAPDNSNPLTPSPWVTETVRTFSFLPQDLALRVQRRDHLAWGDLSAGVVYAFHRATLPYAIDYNPLQPCVDPNFNPLAVGPALTQLRATSTADLPYVDDLTTLRALRDLFALSTAGRRYIDLYYQHAPETGRLAVANPSLVWDSYLTLQNFLPGFKSLAVGDGSDIVISQQMVDQVNDIADRLVAAGSPALGSAINTERGKYNHLQDFAGQTFKQASDILGTSVKRVYLPLIRR